MFYKKYLTFYFMMLVSQLVSQDLDDLEFGTHTTFEIVTWNIEWFPKNGQTTVNYVTNIIQSLEIDVLAIQEVDDTDMFDQLLENLPNYEGYYESSWFAGLAYIYNTNIININDIYEIYTTSPYWSPFPRSPMVMDMDFMGENIIIINNHFKCCGNGYLDPNDTNDEETRRFIATNLLKEYVDTNFPNEKVIILGDLNDVLTDSPQHNVFQTVIDDPSHYLFADMDIAEGPSSGWSYPTWPSHIDHILITNELFDDFERPGSTIQTIIIDDYLDNGWYEYNQNVSDHRPVALKINFDNGLNVEYATGWNLVGLPVINENIDYQYQFPNAVEGTLYSYYEVYEIETTLENGLGYWLRFETNHTNPFAGEPLSQLEIELNVGWNLISGLTWQTQVNSIIDSESIIIEGTIYGFYELYENSDFLIPGKGYWIKTNNNGSIILVYQ